VLLFSFGREHFAFQHSLGARHRSIILAPHRDTTLKERLQ
jgi:hypothetical protein